MPDLHRWSTPKPNNPFAPNYYISLWVDELPTILIDELMSKVKKEEAE